MTHKRHVKTKAKGTSMAFNSKIGLGKIKDESARVTAFICYSCSKRQTSVKFVTDLTT